jgi:polyisoprenoid-binding protein YceI
MFALLLLGATGNSFAATYKIDPSHSTVGFKVKHLGISKVPGSFAEFTGTFTFDPSKIEDSKADAVISVKSVDTSDKKRDDHLRGEDFFAADKFPNISFKTTKIEAVIGQGFKATGDLTIRGITKPVSLDVSFTGAAKDPWGKERAAFSATTKINRKDFGLTWSKVLETGGLVVGDEVEILIEIEGVKES